MGLSTSPSGRLGTVGQLWQAYQDTSRSTGYWLNLPHNVSGLSYPSVALRFLKDGHEDPLTLGGGCSQELSRSAKRPMPVRGSWTIDSHLAK